MTILLPERLHAARLILRAPRQADAAPLFAAYTQDAEVSRHMTWRPHQHEAQTAQYIDACIDAWASGRTRSYMLTLLDEPERPIGMLEARLYASTIDLGYVLQRASWGQGLMPEAVTALATAALAVPACFRVQATCHTENLASVRLLERCGFSREGRIERHAVLPNLSAEPLPSFMYARCR